MDTAEDRMGSISRWLEKDKGLIKAQLWFKVSSERAERHHVLASDLMVKHLLGVCQAP